MTVPFPTSDAKRPENPREQTLRVLVIENEPAAGPGKVGDWLMAEGIGLEICRPYAGDAIPEIIEADGLLILGGSVGPHDDLDAPWLPALRELLRTAVTESVPTWGICLGAQLLAVALGGTADRGSNGSEVGVQPLQIDPTDDPLFRDLPATAYALQFHQEAVTKLPEGAVLLASNDTYQNQAFRVGACAWGVQFHPEVSTSEVRTWNRLYPEVGAQGQGRGEVEIEQSQLDSTWAQVSKRWAAQIRARASDS